MKKMMCIITAVLLVSCGQPNQDLVFDKLEGIWQLEGESAFEQWSRNPDGSYTSVMFSVKNMDTSYSEKVKIYKNGNAWVFETLVQGQNDGKTVKFNSTLLNPTQVSFENKKHDFPKIIHYSIESPLKLYAFIAGDKDTMRFNFLRKP